jgi:hypothetical protein
MKIIWKSVLLFTLLTAGSANAAFLNYYDVANWSSKGSAGAGVINTSGAPDKVVMTSANEGGGWKGWNDSMLSIKAEQAGMVSFSWNYRTDDARGRPGWDRFGIWLNGVFKVLIDTHIGKVEQSGVYSFMVSKGQIFGFKIASSDSLNGGATTSISDFKTTPLAQEPASLVPLPAAAWLIALPLVSLLGRKRKANILSNPKLA